MLLQVIPLYGFFLESAFNNWILPIFALAFIATVPPFIRSLFRS